MRSRPPRRLRAHLAALGLLLPGVGMGAGATMPTVLHHRQHVAPRDRIDTLIAVERGTLLDLTAGDGRVAVRGWDRSEMDVHAECASCTLALTRGSRALRLEAQGGRGAEATMMVRVPRGTRVVVTTTNGDVQVVDVGGEVDAHLVKGNVTLRDISGRTSVENVSGDIVVSDVEGSLRIKALGGDITVTNVHGDVDLNANSGTVALRKVRADRVQVQLVDGSVTFDGPVVAGGRYGFDTHSGDVHLYLADGARGTIELQSFSGKLRSTYPLTLLPDSAGRPLFGSPLARSLAASGKVGPELTLRRLQRLVFGGGGSGSAQIAISTFDGDVRIDRGPGRTN